MRRLTVMVASIVLVAGACEGGLSNPDAVLTGYQDARNAGDIDDLMALYSEDAVVENHPVADGRTATGTADIRSLELAAIAFQGATGSIEFIERVVSGNTVTFKDRFQNARGECFSGGGHHVTVEDGKITEFVWGNEEAPDLCS